MGVCISALFWFKFSLLKKRTEMYDLKTSLEMRRWVEVGSDLGSGIQGDIIQ